MWLEFPESDTMKSYNSIKMKYVAFSLMFCICVYGIDEFKGKELGSSLINCVDDTDCLMFCSWLCHTPRVGKCEENRCLCRALPQEAVGLPYTKQEVNPSEGVRCHKTWED
ncbi:unnamed protein product [Euphydryas editha]|uniref:Uncharacterized protein n=1 Tax=Euphydryas editha TaxID=104508 RepID=A0AAU9V0Z4_EUPED|nr:unnamed protein product [Euphydryas editha]